MKRIPAEAKVSAYNDAIDFLIAQESESDTDDDRAARKWLAGKLNKEADRIAARLSNVAESRTSNAR